MNEKIKTAIVSTLWIITAGLIIATVVWLCCASPFVASIVVALFLLCLNIFLATIVTSLIMKGEEFFLSKDWMDS